MAGKKYKVIYADPPWEYKQSGPTRGIAKKYYPTMSTEEICALPVGNIATDDAVLFMWATFPNIGEALKVIGSWGFIYKTAAFVWVKKNPKSNTNFWGMGAYTRANAEPCLLAIRKNTRASEVVKRRDIHQIIEAPVREHSRKPDEARERIVQLLGDVPRIELFAREKAPGWDVWGNEVNSDVDLWRAASGEEG